MDIAARRADYERQLEAARAQAAEAARVVARLEGAVIACDELEAEASNEAPLHAVTIEETPCPTTA